jgi:hypothetical protein
MAEEALVSAMTEEALASVMTEEALASAMTEALVIAMTAVTARKEPEAMNGQLLA